MTARKRGQVHSWGGSCLGYDSSGCRNSMTPEPKWLAKPQELTLKDGEVHIWWAPLSLEAAVLERMRLSLSADEKSRADRFVFAGDRDHFVAARGILRELLGSYAGTAPAELKFDYGSQGKPELSPTHPPIRFNLSHSHGLAVYAFARERQLGIDLELIQPEFAGDEIAERYFSSSELAELRALPPQTRAEGFFLCWTRKEAYVKARGEGLKISLASFDVSLTPGKQEKLLSDDALRWQLHSFQPAPQYVGALVAENGVSHLNHWEWNP
jgi:4'-phosphopantetheinyl transferase